MPGQGGPRRQARDLDSLFWVLLYITAVAGREAPRCVLLIWWVLRLSYFFFLN